MSLKAYLHDHAYDLADLRTARTPGGYSCNDLTTITGLVDSQYHGELILQLYNSSSQNIFLSVGEKPSQMIFREKAKCHLSIDGQTIPENSGQQRGNNGFGSSNFRCHLCGDQGHFRRECPKNETNHWKQQIRSWEAGKDDADELRRTGYPKNEWITVEKEEYEGTKGEAKSRKIENEDLDQENTH